MKSFILAALLAAAPLPLLAQSGAEAPPPAAHMGHAGMDHSAPAGIGAAATLGALQITDGTSRATAPGAKVGAGYLSITNTGATSDRLLAAKTPLAAEVQIHEMSMAGDVMQMRELPGGLPLPAGETVRLATGGLHLMLLGLSQPLAAGEVVPVTLTFERAGEVTLALPVLPRGTPTTP